ncbi:MAG: ATP-binding protein [Actinomycetota bacterium]|nr:ATP-binding protein [Actinomycetota bacterium]
MAEGAVSAAALTEEVVDQLRHDAEFVALVADKLGLVGKPELRTIDELIDNDEDYAVEFKSTARWDLREGQPSKAMEDAIVKTVAAFLNTDGGTLLVGIGPDGAVIGLGHDYGRVKPKNGDGLVNWLTTHLINALGHTPVTRTRARITIHAGHELCRVDVAASPTPVWARTSKDEHVFFVRMNNSTRALPENEVEQYRVAHWPTQ